MKRKKNLNPSHKTRLIFRHFHVDCVENLGREKMRKNPIAQITLLLAGIAIFAGTVLAGTQDFDLVNRTGKVINNVYVSKVTTSDWEEDVLGQDTLANGSKVHITFNAGDDECYWDVRAVDTTGGTYTFYKQNLCTLSEIVVTARDKDR